jgi:pyrimidine deaminase RibD-like protein
LIRRLISVQLICDDSVFEQGCIPIKTPTSTRIDFLASSNLDNAEVTKKPRDIATSISDDGSYFDLREVFMGTDIDFMKMAINEAKQCQGEDNRSHPKVGAIVVKDGEVTTAFRGELGAGDHAEFTALEKKMGKQIIAGATVYTTLEPCTTRNHPKLPCVERLIERKVKRVVIGMLDPNPNICGRGLWRLREASIETDLFPHVLMAEIEELNRDFIRAHRPLTNIVARQTSAEEVSLPVAVQPSKQEQDFGDMHDFFLSGDYDSAERVYHQIHDKASTDAERNELECLFLFFKADHARDQAALSSLARLASYPATAMLAASLAATLKEKVGAVNDAFELTISAADLVADCDQKARLLLRAANLALESKQNVEAVDLSRRALGVAAEASTRADCIALISRMASGPFAGIQKAALLVRSANIHPTPHRRFEAGWQLVDSKLNAAGALQYSFAASGSEAGGALNNLSIAFSKLGLPGMATAKLRQAADGGLPLAIANLALQYVQAGFVEEAESWIGKGITQKDPHEIGAAMTALKEMKTREADLWKDIKAVAHEHARFLDELASAILEAANQQFIEGSWDIAGREVTVALKDGNCKAIWKQGDKAVELSGVMVGSAMFGSIVYRGEGLSTYFDESKTVVLIARGPTIGGMAWNEKNEVNIWSWKRVPTIKEIGSTSVKAS